MSSSSIITPRLLRPAAAEQFVVVTKADDSVQYCVIVVVGVELTNEVLPKIFGSKEGNTLASNKPKNRG